jgi:formylglycine-generating enzyme required for sulfatase activity
MGSEPWDVGSGIEELNGSFDMMGNVWEWMESPWISGNYWTGSYRGARGGWCNVDGLFLASSYRDGNYPSTEYDYIGFRVASDIPEPSSLVLLSLAGLALLKKRC